MNRFLVVFFVLTGMVFTIGSKKIEHPEYVEIITITDTSALDTTFFHLQNEASANYAITKASIESDRLAFWAKYQKAPTDSGKDEVIRNAGKYLEEALVNKVFHFWYGTTWSFEGHTNSPGVGEVACGYFVSTTLKHAGLNLNRYRLAQQAPLNEAKSLAIHESVMQWENVTVDSFRNIVLDNHQDGLYFVGLDNHVGYLLIRKGEVFFLHSNYTGPGEVCVEPILDSYAFPSSTYYLVPVSNNKGLIRSWLTGATVNVVMPTK